MPQAAFYMEPTVQIGDVTGLIVVCGLRPCEDPNKQKPV